MSSPDSQEEPSGGPLDRWQYTPSMPTLPVLETGLSPTIQWMLLPLLVLAIVRRQLAGALQD